jgi:hypothetical protein
MGCGTKCRTCGPGVVKNCKKGGTKWVPGFQGSRFLGSRVPRFEARLEVQGLRRSWLLNLMNLEPWNPGTCFSVE